MGMLLRASVLLYRYRMMQLMENLIYSVLLLACFLHFTSAEDTESRDEKLISTFQIVRFPNDVCVGSNSRNGTCYTSAECSDKSGTSSGSCADGFGVCCTFLTTSCGGSTSENLTYWATVSGGVTSAAQSTCGLTVCPMNDDICHLRLDFTTFVITGPNTLSIFQTRRRIGAAPISDIVDVTGEVGGTSYTTNCLYDTFSAQGASPSSTPPEVCGTLTGTHMYVEADVDRCNLLQFTFSDVLATGATILRGTAAFATRSWDITVAQIECTSASNPPPGCTQWFFGAAGAYTLENYNYVSDTAQTSNTGIHLANQNQRICIRRERGNCIGCFWAAAAEFAVSGSSQEEANYVNAGGCCGYLDAPSGGHLANAEALSNAIGLGMNDFEEAVAVGQIGFDCVIIPGAFVPTTAGIEFGVNDGTPTDAATPVVAQSATVITTSLTETNYHTPSGPQICGNGAGLGIGGAGTGVVAAGTGNLGVMGATTTESETPLTICTRADPFILEFLSDDIDGMGGQVDANFGGETNVATLPASTGFQIHHTQLECT